MPDSIYIFIILALFIGLLYYRTEMKMAREKAKVLAYENAELQHALDSVLRKH